MAFIMGRPASSRRRPTSSRRLRPAQIEPEKLDKLQSTNQHFFDESFNEELRGKLEATPAAGAKICAKGVDERLNHQLQADGSRAHEDGMTDLLRHACPVSKHCSIYQTATAEEAILRFHRQRASGKNMSKDEKENRWHRCLMKRWNRADDAETQASTNFSVLPAGRRPNHRRDDKQEDAVTFTITSWTKAKVLEALEAALRSRGLKKNQAVVTQAKFVTNGGQTMELDDSYRRHHPEGPPASAFPMRVVVPLAKAAQPSVQKSNAETRFDKPSAWAVDRATDSKQNQYLTQYQSKFVSHVSSAFNDIKAHLVRRKQQQSGCAWYGESAAPPVQESSYQTAFGSARRPRSRNPKSMFDDF